MEEIYLNSGDSSFQMNNYGYNALMNCIARSSTKGRSDRVREVMNRMNELYAKTHNDSLLPDKVSYTSLLKAIMSDRIPGFATECKAILELMDFEYSKGNLKLKPDLITYGTVINAIAIGDFPEECEKLLDKMEKLASEGDKDLYPNIICYNTVMNAYGKRRRTDAVIQVERIFNRIDESREKGNVRLKPNVVTYSTFIDALARSNEENKVQRAEALFNQLLEKYNETHDERLCPSTPLWNSLMLLYAESDIHDKADKALETIRRMEKSGNVADTVVYNTLLKACAKSSGRYPDQRDRVIEISKIALEALRSKKGLKVDSYAYNSLLWISNNCIDDPEEKQATIKALFKSSCNDGEVNKLVFDTFKRVASHELFFELIGSDKGVSLEALHVPVEWSRNIRQSKYRGIAKNK